MTLRTKTSIFLTLAILSLFSVSGFLSLRFLEDSLKKSIFNSLESVSITSSESISKFLNETLNDTQVIASFLPKKALEDRNFRVVEEYLKTMMGAHPKFENGMFLLDNKGTLWVDYPVYPGTRGKNFAHREYFKTTMEKQRGIIGTPYQSARTGEPVLTFTALLRGANNQVLGLIGCSVQLLHPNALAGIRKTKIGETGYIYVIDTSRLMILHPEDKKLLQRDVPVGANKLLDAAINGFEGVGETVNSRGVPMLLSLRNIPGTNWIVGAQQTKSEAFASIKKARNQIIWWAFLAVLMSISIGAVVVRRLTKPLVDLRKVAIKLGQNALSLKEESYKKEGFKKELKEITSSDEIGDLARALEEMSSKLDQTFVSLKVALRDWERTFDSVQDAIFILDRENWILRINRSASKLIGLSTEKVLGQPCYKFIHGTEEPPTTCPHHQTLATGKFAQTEIEESFLKGYFEITTTPIYDETNQTIGTVHVMRDITTRKKAEEALRESEGKYRSLVDHANDAIFIAQDEMVKFPNPSTLTLTGYSEEDYAVIPFKDFIHPEDREMVIQRYNQRLRGEDAPNNYSFRVINKAGGELWVQLNAVLIEWDKKPAVLCFIRDITSHKKLEAQFQQAQKMEAVGTLAGGIAHDFNNLLQSIMGYTEILLMDERVRQHASKDLEEIKRAAKRGAELTQQLLTFSRKVQSKLRPIDLNQEVVQVQKILQRTIPKMIEVELSLARDLKLVNADPAQVEQVLLNLAVNARDAMAEGGKLLIKTQNVRLDWEFCKSHLGLEPGDYVELNVSDTGHGMAPETLKNIFDPFYTTKGVGKGTGLGLAMVYGIVKSHKGHIFCESKPNEGTTFKIYFQVAEEERIVEESEENQEVRGGAETILLVDDEESIRNFGELIFRRYGYTILPVSDGESALKLYQEKKDEIDLVVLDLIMPVIGGKKCLELLLQINPKVKVVMASGYFPEGAVKEVLERGAKNFINKPFNITEMLQVVRKVLDEN